MKKAMLAAAITLLAACLTLPDSIKGPFARAAHGATTTDTVDQPAASSPFPAVTDKGLLLACLEEPHAPRREPALSAGIAAHEPACGGRGHRVAIALPAFPAVVAAAAHRGAGRPDRAARALVDLRHRYFVLSTKCLRHRSTDRRHVEQAALGPQAVVAALETERREIDVEAFGVVAHLLDDVIGPAVVEREHLAEVAARADEALDGGVGAPGLLVDVLRREAELLGLDHGEKRPLDDVEPAVVAMADCRAERFLGDELRQDDVLVGLRRARGAQGDEAGLVCGVGVAAAVEVGVQHFVQLLDHHRLEAYLVGAEVVCEVELVGGARLHADGGAIELLRALHVQLLRHHEALAVVIVDADEVQANARVARKRPGGIAREDVDLARLHRGEALLRGERREAYFSGIAEHGGGDGAAEVDVDAAPDAFGIGLRESGQPGVDAALHEAFLAHGVEGRLCGGAGAHEHQRGGEPFHEASPCSRNSRTRPICAASSSVGAWPTPAISVTSAFGPRRVISAVVARERRSDCAPRITSVGQRIAS